MDFINCPCSGRSLARLIQPAILALLVQQTSHGYEILQRLSEMAFFRDEPPDPTGIYRALRQMEEDGLLTSSWDLADRGPAKRRFKLTAAGRACLVQWQQSIKAYAKSVYDLLALMRHSLDEPTSRRQRTRGKGTRHGRTTKPRA